MKIASSIKSISNKDNSILNTPSEEKLLKANRLYLFISQMNHLICRATDETTLFKGACHIAINIGKFKMAWIGSVNEETKVLTPLFHDGLDLDYLSIIKIIADKTLPEGRGPAGMALIEGRYSFCNDIANDPMMKPWRDEALKRNYLSSISLPIKKSGKAMGTFTLYADTKNFFTAEEISLLEEITSDISFALEVFEKEILRKKAEAAVLKSEKRYQTLTEVSPVGIFHTDAFGHTTYVNPRWSEISGLSQQKALGNGWLEAVHKDDKILLAEGWTAAALHHQISISEYRFVRPDGSIAWVIGQAIPEKNLKDEIIGYVGTITDITERKKAELELSRVYKEKETILNRINDGMVSLDNEWRYTFLNDAALATHPMGREEIIGKTLWEVHPDMVGTKFSEKYHLALHTQKVQEIEDYYPHMDIWFSVKVYPSADGLTIFYTDITERKRIETEIIKTSRQLQELTTHLQSIREEERKRIGREIHDELGQQLTAIKMDIAWINKKTLASEQIVKDKLANVIQLLDSSNQAIRRILNELRPAVLDEHGLLDAIAWHNKQFMESTGIAIELVADTNEIKIKEQIATCVFRVYQEALTNIVRHAQANKVVTSIRMTDKNIIVSIEDNGKGFDAFVEQPVGSFGILGMRERVRALGGSFTLTANIGTGTKINISLPLNN
jgi:PAS domain S-box-containing protein